MLLISSVLIWFFPFCFSPSRTWENFLLSHGRHLEKSKYGFSCLTVLISVTESLPSAARCRLFSVMGFVMESLWTLSVGIKPVSIVYWKMGSGYHSWAQSYSVDVWNTIIDAFLSLVEIVLTLRYRVDHSLEIGIVWLFTLCLLSGGMWSVLVVASESGKCQLSLEPVVPGDKQLCKRQRGSLVSLVIFLILVHGLWTSCLGR